MKKIFLVIVICLFIVGCGDLFYENVVSIGPMDEISGETQESMGNIFENLSAVFANDSSV